MFELGPNCGVRHQGPAHTCVSVGSRDTVRSGEFIVGNFVANRQSWDGTPENSKLAYTPLYPDLS
jgi:hypothetical protein